MNTREAIKSAQRKFEDVTIDEGITVRITQMTAAQALDLAEFTGTNQEITRAMLACCIVDESGAPIYDRDTIAEVYQQRLDAVMVLINVARRINGFDGDEVKKD